MTVWHRRSRNARASGLTALAEKRPERPVLRQRAVRTSAFSFAKHVDGIEVRYRAADTRSVAPAAWMARWIPATLCALRLSAMTRSPRTRA